jgi:hypothetical protein
VTVQRYRRDNGRNPWVSVRPRRPRQDDERWRFARSRVTVASMSTATHAQRKSANSVAARRFLNPKALGWVVVLFAVEVLIALFLRDRLVRPYGGDFLAVILVYAGLRVVCLRSSSRVLAAWSFTIGAMVELIQAIGVPSQLGLARHPILSVVVGSFFDWSDLLAYALGVIVVATIDERTTLLR